MQLSSACSILYCRLLTQSPPPCAAPLPTDSAETALLHTELALELVECVGRQLQLQPAPSAAGIGVIGTGFEGSPQQSHLTPASSGLMTGGMGGYTVGGMRTGFEGSPQQTRSTPATSGLMAGGMGGMGAGVWGLPQQSRLIPASSGPHPLTLSSTATSLQGEVHRASAWPDSQGPPATPHPNVGRLEWLRWALSNHLNR